MHTSTTAAKVSAHINKNFISQLNNEVNKTYDKQKNINELPEFTKL